MWKRQTHGSLGVLRNSKNALCFGRFFLAMCALTVSAAPGFGQVFMDSPRKTIPSGAHEFLGPTCAPESGTFGVPGGQFPPDANCAVGPNSLVYIFNGKIGWLTKDGLYSCKQSLDSFFAAFSPFGHVTPFDPRVVFDPYAQRFVVTATDVDDDLQTSRIFIAVSDDDDPNGTWHTQVLDSEVYINGEDYSADYPAVAVNGEAIFITAIMFPYGQGGGASYRESIPFLVEKCHGSYC